MFDSHALHPARADGFDPRLLDRVEQGARRRALRREAPVDRVAVAGKAERERIGKPADDRGFARIGLARRLGQPGLRPFRRGHERRLVGRIGDLELGMTRQRPRARRERPLERLIGRIGLAGGGFAVAGRLDVDARHSGPSKRGAAAERGERQRLLYRPRPLGPARQSGASLPELGRTNAAIGAPNPRARARRRATTRRRRAPPAQGSRRPSRCSC